MRYDSVLCVSVSIKNWTSFCMNPYKKKSLLKGKILVSSYWLDGLLISYFCNPYGRVNPYGSSRMPAMALHQWNCHSVHKCRHTKTHNLHICYKERYMLNIGKLSPLSAAAEHLWLFHLIFFIYFPTLSSYPLSVSLSWHENCMLLFFTESSMYLRIFIGSCEL